MSSLATIDVRVASRFFAVLALLTLASTVAVWGLVLVRRSRPDSAVTARLGEIADVALWLAWLVAFVTSVGSLVYSLYFDFVPCELCWYQRICIYPMSIVLLVAALRRDRAVWQYAIGPLLIGIAIAAYHTQLQAYPSQQSFCSTLIPCTTRYVWEFGFVSLPLMDLCALLFITTMLLLGRSHQTEVPS